MAKMDVCTSKDAMTLYMPELEPYMNINFLRNAFESLGEVISNIQIRHDGRHVTKPYSFIVYNTLEEAIRGNQNLKGCTIPGSFPPKLFKVRPKIKKFEGVIQDGQTLFSLYLTGLSQDVHNADIYQQFHQRYKSVVAAIGDRDLRNACHGTGVVEFVDETELKQALIDMDGYLGIGQNMISTSLVEMKLVTGLAAASKNDEDDEIEDPNGPSVDDYNDYYMDESEELYHAIEANHWNPIDHANAMVYMTNVPMM